MNRLHITISASNKHCRCTYDATKLLGGDFLEAPDDIKHSRLRRLAKVLHSQIRTLAEDDEQYICSNAVEPNLNI